MKKRVCMLVTDALSFNVLCRGQLEFFRDNYDVELTLLCGGSRTELDKLRQRDIGKVVYMPFRRQPSLVHDLWALLRLLSFLLFRRFDVVVYSTPKAMLLGALATFITFQRKRVAVIRGRAYEGFYGLKRMVYVFFDRAVVALSNESVCISHSLKNSYISDGFNPKKIVVLGAGSSNGIDLARFSCESVLEKKTDFFTVGVIGRICKDKGIEQVEEIVDRLVAADVAVNFVLVGSIEDDIAKASVGRMIKHDAVSYSDNVDNIEDFFKLLDLHLFLTHREGFGNVAIEAAAFSVPTFAFDVVGVRDSVKDGISGLLFDYLDVDQVSDAIVQAARNPEKFKRDFSEARQWVAENFDRESVWRKYFSFYLQ